jgi:hypothetical protein
LTEGARGVFMLMYELVDLEGSSQREVSMALTIDTVETAPDSPTVTEEVSEFSDSEDESPALAEGPFDLENDATPNRTPSLLEMVESKLEGTHISPSSSIASNSTEDSIIDLEQKTTRSTSFSSVHSRPETPIFEVLDPKMSPRPMKRIRRDIIEEGGVGLQSEEVEAD